MTGGDTVPENTKKRNARQYAWQKETYDRKAYLLYKGQGDAVDQAAKSAGISASEWIREAIRDKMASSGDPYIRESRQTATHEIVRYPDEIAIIPDLEAYARSAGQTVDDYIAQAIRERMQRQDAEYTEDIQRVNLDDL